MCATVWISLYSGARTCQALLPRFHSTKGMVVVAVWHAFWIVYFDLDAKLRRLKRISLATLLRHWIQILLLMLCVATRATLQAAWNTPIAQVIRNFSYLGCLQYAVLFLYWLIHYGPPKVSLWFHLRVFCFFQVVLFGIPVADALMFDSIIFRTLALPPDAPTEGTPRHARSSVPASSNTCQRSSGTTERRSSR